MAVDRYGRKISSAEAKRRAGYRSDLQYRSADAISGGRAGELKKRASYRKAAGTKAATTKTRAVGAKGTGRSLKTKTYGKLGDKPKPVSKTPGAVSGTAPSMWNKRQQTAAGRRQGAAKAVAGVATQGPLVYGLRTAAGYAGSRVARRLPKVSTTQIFSNVRSGAKSGWSSAEKWWRGY